ncbi:nuclear transport factor 2 family protein [Tabrizicola sp.]|uniref:nuclear transport factor 2 family protein n=1 Tax=Tabrizicola sp. TaxID=2005166 RepID=UPI003F2FC31D
MTEIASSKDIAMLIERAARHNDLFMNGDPETAFAVNPTSPDFSIMTPFGSASTGGFTAGPERMAAMAKLFQSATTSFELLSAHAVPDMVVLVAIERQTAVIGGLPEQEWSLRVTLVFRRTDTDWELVHRHADPLVAPISLDQLAIIARGAVDPA